MRHEIEAVLVDVARMLRLHDGGIELVDVNETTGEVSVRLTGSCVGCPLSEVTLRRGVETALVEAIPGIRSVIAVS